MKKLFLFFAATGLMCAQAVGMVDVQLVVTGTAGPIQCVITPVTGGQSANVVCKKGTVTVATAVQSPAVDAAGVVLTVAAPILPATTPPTSDAVSVLLRKTTGQAPVYWEVAANGVVRSGTF